MQRQNTTSTGFGLFPQELVDEYFAELDAADEADTLAEVADDRLRDEAIADLELRHRQILALRETEERLRARGFDLFYLTSAVRPSQPETRNLERR